MAALDPALILVWHGYDCSGERASVLISFEERILRRDQDSKTGTEFIGKWLAKKQFI